MKCPIYHKWLLLLFLLPLFLFCPNVKAETVEFSGAYSLYYQTTSNGTLASGYSGIYSGYSFPSSNFIQLPAYANQSYTVMRMFQFQNTTYQFTANSIYTITMEFDTGSYVYLGWPTFNTNGNMSISSCPGGSCSVVWSYQYDSTHTSTNYNKMILTYIPNQNRTGVTISLGSYVLSNTGIWYNAHTFQQGFRIRSSTINDTPSDTQLIIQNNNENTQQVVDEIAQQTAELIESQQVCNNVSYSFDRNNVSDFSCGYLGSNGSIIGSDCSYHVTGFLPVSSGTFSLIAPFENQYLHYCLYNESYNLVSCHSYQNNTRSITLPINVTNEKYIKLSVPNSSSTTLVGRVCKGGSQAVYDFVNDTHVDVGAETNSLFDSFDFFHDDSLSGIITLPLQVFNTLNSDTCSPIVLSLFGHNITLPCGTTIFWGLNNQYISNFRAIWNLLFFGLIIYRLSVQLYVNVSNILDPTKDSMGVFKL